MENLILLLTASFVWYKSARKFRRILVGDKGSSVYFPAGIDFERTGSANGDELYFAEHTEEHVTYGVLIANLQEKLPLETGADVLRNYMNRLRKPFNAPINTGVVACPSHSVVMEDYWQDEDMVDWKVKGFTNGATLAVLYIRNINDVEVEKQEMFLESFRF